MSALLADADRPVLITGGAGFIGTNLAARLLEAHHRVIILDNFSRPFVERNAEWLADQFGSHVEILRGDVRDGELVRAAVREAAYVFHFAAQVAVTTSLKDPTHDFDVNARGTVNVLEALRAVARPIPLVYTSTNKVYGCLEDVALEEVSQRVFPLDVHLSEGIDEERPLQFESPYGCSKGAADQYVLDYARSFRLSAAVFRMSCIYGPRQFGNEDQGWVAHFIIRAMEEGVITIYGDGMQVRDVLFVQDLVDAFLHAVWCMEKVTGQAFNIGGGALNTTSLLELVDRIGRLHGRRPSVRFERPRIGDQRYYVSDTRKFTERTGWAPRVGVDEGVRRLFGWLGEARRKPARMHLVAEPVQ